MLRKVSVEMIAPKPPKGTSLFAVNVNTGEWHYVNHAFTWQTMPSPLPEPPEIRALKSVCDDIRAFKVAGDELALAASLVVAEHDGIHRMRLAIANWHKVNADESGRGERYK